MTSKVAPLAAALACILVGPAISQVGSADSSATFIFKKSYDRGLGVGTSTRQLYYHLPNGDCRGRRKQAAFSWITGEQKQRILPAGRSLTLWMFTQHFRPGWEYVCQNAAAFTPRPGATYEVALRSTVGSHCEVSVVESSTGQVPADIKFDSSLTCR